MKSNTKQIKRALSPKSRKIPTLLRTGSTVLDIALSGTINGGFPKGGYTLLVGDSSSGKTFLSLTCLAEAASNPEFDDYRFVFINAENGALMDFDKFFGKKVADRVEEFTDIDSIEDFYYLMADLLEDGRPFIAILDSMDVLSSKEDDAKFEEGRKASKDNKDAGNSMGDGKAKKNSRFIRRTISRLKKSGSILIIINQTRDNIGFGAKFNPKTRSGGRAMKFYAGVEIWTSVVGSIKRTVMGKPRKVGVVVKCEVKKNRLTGNDCSVEVPFSRHYGIDDIGSCIRFLVGDGAWWKETKGKITAEEFDFIGGEARLIKHIEENELENDLKAIVLEAWTELEKALRGTRKKRYA